jgi:hypothetical protein
MLYKVAVAAFAGAIATFHLRVKANVAVALLGTATVTLSS